MGSELTEPTRGQRRTFAVTPSANRSRLGFGRFMQGLDPMSSAIVLGAAIALVLVLSVTFGVGWPATVGLELAVLLLLFVCPWLLARALEPVAVDPKTIVVAADGLVLDYADGKPYFVALERIQEVSRTGDAVTIRVRRLGVIALRLENAVEALALERLLQTTDQSPQGVEHVRALAARVEGAHRERVERLAGAAAGGGYRDEHLSPDDLAALMAAPDAEPRYRIAAAAALMKLDEPRARVAIEAARGAIVNEPLRVALDEIGRGQLDDAHVDEAEQWHRG
jgi:hypothetical protein